MYLTNLLDEIFDVSVDENHLQKQLIEKETEIDLYLADETRIDNSMNAISYWNLYKSLYPNLARIAKRVLAIPAMNTSVKRLFSHSSNTITNRQTLFDADKINYLLFIKQNMRTLIEIYCPEVDLYAKRKK